MGEVEGQDSFLLHDASGVFLRICTALQVDLLESERDSAENLLAWVTVDVDEGRPQHFVPLDGHLEHVAQRGHIQIAVNHIRLRDIVGGGVAESIEKPKALLRV